MQHRPPDAIGLLRPVSALFSACATTALPTPDRHPGVGA